MSSSPDRAHNYHLGWTWDTKKRPRGLTVRLSPAFWKSDRKAVRKKAVQEITAWLKELRIADRCGGSG